MHEGRMDRQIVSSSESWEQRVNTETYSSGIRIYKHMKFDLWEKYFLVLVLFLASSHKFLSLKIIYASIKI